MKVTFINAIGTVGGAEKVLLAVIDAIRIGCPHAQLSLLVFSPGSLVEQAQKRGVSVVVLELPDRLNQLGDSSLKSRSGLASRLALAWQLLLVLPAIASYLARFRQTLIRLAPDLIHSNGLKAHILSAPIKPRNVPLVWHLHDFYGSRPLAAKILRWCSDRANLGIAISQAIASDTQQLLPTLPITTIYNAIDTDRFSPDPKSEEARATGEIRVGLVATFARWKGHDIFLQAAAIAVQKCPHLSLSFHIIGAPIYLTRGSQFSQDELSELARQLGIGDRVEFWGFQADTVPVYRWLDIAVHASVEPEPFGLTIVEAMACAKATIVAQAGGAAELFTHEQDAIGVPPGDRDALAEAMVRLASDAELRQSLGARARQTAVERFSRQRLSAEIQHAYRQVSPNLSRSPQSLG